MKKLISLLSAVAIVSSMCSFTAFAASNARTVTLTTSTTAANKGDEFDATATLSTSNAVKAVGVKIAFDPADIELGLSTTAKSVNLSDYSEFIGTTDFPTSESVYEALIGHKSYVTDTYYNTYTSYAANKNFGSATIDYEVKDGLGRVAFGYAIITAKNELTKTDNMVIGGAVLKVKTSEKKQTTIKLIETNTTDGDNTKYDATVNEVVINLNGYTEDDDEVKAEEQTSGSVKVTYPEGYTGNKNLDGKYIVFKDVVLQGTEVTADTRFDIEYNGTKKRFGATLFETLGVVGQGTLKAESYGFGVAFDSDVNASDVTITKVNETVNE